MTIRERIRGMLVPELKAAYLMRDARAGAEKSRDQKSGGA